MLPCVVQDAQLRRQVRAAGASYLNRDSVSFFPQALDMGAIEPVVQILRYGTDIGRWGGQQATNLNRKPVVILGSLNSAESPRAQAQRCGCHRCAHVLGGIHRERGGGECHKIITII